MTKKEPVAYITRKKCHFMFEKPYLNKKSLKTPAVPIAGSPT